MKIKRRICAKSDGKMKRKFEEPADYAKRVVLQKQSVPALSAYDVKCEIVSCENFTTYCTAIMYRIHEPVAGEGVKSFRSVLYRTQ